MARVTVAVLLAVLLAAGLPTGQAESTAAAGGADEAAGALGSLRFGHAATLYQAMAEQVIIHRGRAGPSCPHYFLAEADWS